MTVQLLTLPQVAVHLAVSLRQVQAGVPIAEVCALLRHGDIRMTMRYAHLEPGNVRAAVERLVSAEMYQSSKWKSA